MPFHAGWLSRVRCQSWRKTRKASVADSAPHRTRGVGLVENGRLSSSRSHLETAGGLVEGSTQRRARKSLTPALYIATEQHALAEHARRLPARNEHNHAHTAPQGRLQNKRPLRHDLSLVLWDTGPAPRGGPNQYRPVRKSRLGTANSALYDGQPSFTSYVGCCRSRSGGARYRLPFRSASSMGSGAVIARDGRHWFSDQHQNTEHQK